MTNPPTQFKEGDEWKGNENGRPKGQRNYATIYREALIKLAESEGTTPEDIESELIVKGALFAKKGDYRFYKDILDRNHGTAIQKSDLTSGGKPIPLFNFIENANRNNDSDPKDTEPNQEN
jgi:hypothetical protein